MRFLCYPSTEGGDSPRRCSRPLTTVSCCSLVFQPSNLSLHQLTHGREICTSASGLARLVFRWCAERGTAEGSVITEATRVRAGIEAVLRCGVDDRHAHVGTARSILAAVRSWRGPRTRGCQSLAPKY